MNTYLLTAIRYVRKREREAEEQRGASSSSLLKISGWRRYHYLATMPLAPRRMAGFYVRSNGLPNSKGAITRSVLTQVGVEASLLQPSIAPNYGHRIRRAFRLIIRAPIATIMAIRLRRRIDRCAEDAGIIIATLLIQRVLERNPRLIPIINSDLSPQQIMLACAAQGISRSAVWWQDDFHYTEPVPFHVTAGVVLNSNGLNALHARNPKSTVLKRDFKSKMGDRNYSPQISLPDQVKKVGVAVNGLFTGMDSEIEMLSRIRKVIGLDVLELRLHPTYNGRIAGLPEEIKLAPKNESVEEFSSRMDVIFSGNSAIQYKLLMAGIPVIHVPDLDNLKFDVYGYVEKGIVFGSTLVNETILERAFSFYRSRSFHLRLQKHEENQFDISGRPLIEIKKLLWE